MNAEGTVRSLASKIGVEVGGPSPWDIQVHNPRFYRRVVADGSLGLGESYMEEWWDCQDLGEFFHRLFLAGVEERDPGRWRLDHRLRGRAPGCRPGAVARAPCRWGPIQPAKYPVGDTTRKRGRTRA